MRRDMLRTVANCQFIFMPLSQAEPKTFVHDPSIPDILEAHSERLESELGWALASWRNAHNTTFRYWMDRLLYPSTAALIIITVFMQRSLRQWQRQAEFEVTASQGSDKR